jgi:hypothetical protein
MSRNLSLLNSQLLINSGSISDPTNNLSVVRNSERVRNDLLNISEYINGLVYHLFKSLPDGLNYPYDAAESGLSGNTLILNPDSESSFGDIFWHATGVDTGRAKTITEAIEAMQSKLLQQQVNISVLQSVNIEELTNQVNSSTAIVNKVKRDVFGDTYNSSTADLTFPLKEYVYQIYSNLFTTSSPISELDTGATTFPALTFDLRINPENVDTTTGSGSPNLKQDMYDMRTAIAGEEQLINLNVNFPEPVFGIDPNTIDHNIKEYVSMLVTKISEVDVDNTLIGTRIDTVEDDIALLQGTDLASTDVAGITEEATSSEVLMGVAANGNNRLFMNPSTFCDTILDNNSATFLAQSNRFGRAWLAATRNCINSGEIALAQNDFSGNVSIDHNNGANYLVVARKTYLVNPRGSTVTFSLNTAGVESGMLYRFKNITSGGQIDLNAGGGYTIDGSANYSLTGNHSCVTLMIDTDLNQLIIVSSHN